MARAKKVNARQLLKRQTPDAPLHAPIDPVILQSIAQQRPEIAEIIKLYKEADDSAQLQALKWLSGLICSTGL